MAALEERRDRMLRLLEQRGIGAGVLQAMRETPREAFVPAPLLASAYEDAPLPIGAGQTISQPYMVALMIEAAEIGPGDRVLEVGAGSGYAAAVASRIAAHVTGVERIEALAAGARAALAGLGIDNVDIRSGDGSGGCMAAGPFDAIIVSAAAQSAPEALKQQLKLGAVLVAPVGGQGAPQRLVKLRRVSETAFTEADLGEVAFVPLIEEKR